MFLVERVTPGRNLEKSGNAANGPNYSIRAALPFSLEVGDKPEPRGDYESTCGCQSVFRVTDEGVEMLKDLEWFRRALIGRPNPCVCLCMGRIQ
jgi:hypothetical protein